MKNKIPKSDLNSPSYMEMALHIEGEKSIILRIPTFWDAVKNQWIGAIKTPITNRLLTAEGKDSFDLQNNFNKVISAALHDPLRCDEVFGMFKPEKEWKIN